jgi:hypothetical protein
MNEKGCTAISHASKITGHGARDTRVFLCFIVTGVVPPISLFIHTMLNTFGLVLAHLHPNSLLALAIFQHFCEAFVGVHPSAPLFCYFYSAHLDTSGTISGSLVLHLHPQMMMHYITMTQRV